MRPVMKITLVVGALCVVAGGTLGIIALRRPPDPLSKIIEPITIVGAMSFDDGGSQAIQIEDARGESLDVCLMDDLDGHQNLVVGHFWPVHDAAELAQHPVGGAEERRFLRLLEKWCRSDPEARWWDRRLDLYVSGQVSPEQLAEGSPEGWYDETACAVWMLKLLRWRNP